MPQTYDPCNLMSNPSLIKFLSTRRGNRHINKKKKKHKETKIIKKGYVSFRNKDDDKNKQDAKN